MKYRLILCSLSLFALSCKQDSNTLFTQLSPNETGIDFTNTITEDKEHNVLTYEYYYNGNGVAVGDVNNDGLADVFFTGNQTPSKLYLNKGNFQFEDITAQAGVAGKNAWRTGVSMADVNGDGLLDIYVCYSAFGTDEDRAEQLFINKGINEKGVPSFSEQAAAYGINAPGTYTSQAAFFDYDLDGDLDLFLLNHSKTFYSPFFNTTRLRNLRHPQFGNRLYRNDGLQPPSPEGVSTGQAHFTDVSAEAGIFGSGMNFGLGIAISDINNDGWPDILVSNDFTEQDYMYLNNGNGTFKDVCKEVFQHMSRSTMGLDIADYNNDLLPDVVTMDMLPESNYRQKILQGADEYDKYTLMVDSGYGHQNSRNMLQLNRGFAPNGLPVFSEIGQLAGISNTDWSWASLFADFDNDGWKDLFITNGYLRDYTNLDFIKYDVASAFKEAASQGKDVSTRESYEKNMPLYDLVNKMPSTKISNYIFHNKKDLTFSNESANWGVAQEGISSGAVYADMDNDGDLDLIVCNNNDPVWLYKNNAETQQKNNFLRIKLKGDKQNTYGLGAKVIVTTDSTQQLQEMYPVRGYQSSVDYVLNFGLGKQQPKEVKVIWSKDSATIIKNPAVNTTLTITKKDAVAAHDSAQAIKNLFTDITATSGLTFKHVENKYVEFKRDFLAPYELSRQGPKMAKGDVNNDGLEDIFIGGAAGQSGQLYIQTGNEKFRLLPSQPWETDAICEDIGSLFFDADNDGDADLYVVSGGSEWSIPAGEELQDRLYINDGKGNFSKSANVLPAEVYSGSVVTAADYDKDGDLDLFVGARCIPGNYPLSIGNILLRNDVDATTHAAHFTDVTKAIAGDSLLRTGMTSDAVWNDIDKDGWPDLIIVGDWMPITIYKNEGGQKFSNITTASGLSKSNGWWCKIVPADIDNDGDIDFIAGNSGTNTQFKTNADQPLVTYVDDFDGNGRIDPVMTWYIQHVSYPFNTRDELVGQMPVLNKKILKYADFAKSTINDLLSPEQLDKARKFYIYNTQTSLLVNNGGKFELKPLPLETQFSMMNTMLYKDFDGDGKQDILIAGNFYRFRVQQGRSDAALGSLLKGDGKGNFAAINRSITNLYIPGDVRDMTELKGKNGTVIVVSKNNDAVQVLR